MLFLLAVTVALTLIATSAYAGTYDVWSCSGPSGEPLPERGWTPSDRGGTTSSSCGSRGGSFSAHLSPHAVSSQGYARWTFDAPANTTIADVTINRFASASSSGYMGPWHRSYYLFRDAPIVMEGYVTDFCVAILSVCDRRGDPMAPFSAQSQYSTPIQAQRIIASVQCDGTAPCEPREGEAAGLVQVYRARVGIADGLPPAFSAAPSGSLLEPSGPVHGERMARFDGKDLGGGLFSAELVVDGNKVAESRVTAEGCREPFDAPVPCPGEAAGTIGFDTAALENGPHRVQVALLDAARNRTLSDPVLVSVQNDKGPNGQGASRVARLRARFRSAKTDVQRERVVGFGKTAVVVGRLVDQRGAAIRGAELRAHTRLDRLGGRERRVATVRTDDHGRYRWRVPKGPSRLVRIGYRAYHSDPASRHQRR